MAAGQVGSSAHKSSTEGLLHEQTAPKCATCTHLKAHPAVVHHYASGVHHLGGRTREALGKPLRERFVRGIRCRQVLESRQHLGGGGDGMGDAPLSKAHDDGSITACTGHTASLVEACVGMQGRSLAFAPLTCRRRSMLAFGAVLASLKYLANSFCSSSAGARSSDMY
jgi:hypothetical protein